MRFDTYIHTYKQFIFFFPKTNSNISQVKSYDGFVDEMERERETFSTQRHALFVRNGRPPVREDAYRERRQKKKRVYVRSVFMIKFLCFWNVAIGFRPSARTTAIL